MAFRVSRRRRVKVVATGTPNLLLGDASRIPVGDTDSLTGQPIDKTHSIRRIRMTNSQAATIGYYTVIEDERTGWTGGLLILDRGGRPLEFQCTLPVRPTRSHEILYGPTLRQHLIGEVIGKLLVTRSKTPIGLLCCDQPEALVLGTMIDRPVVLVCDAAEENEGPITDDMLAGAGLVEVAGARFRVPLESTEMVQQMAANYDDLPDAVEPFERIREAIGEAHSQLARQQRQAA